MDPELGLFVFSLLVCILLSAFFSASETAFMAVNRVKLKTLSQSGNRKAGKALTLAEDSDRLLTTVLIGNNIVNIAGTALATVLFTRLLGNHGPAVSTVVMTLLILFLGEVTPKTMAKRFPERFAMAVAPVMLFLQKLLMPLSFLFSRWQAYLSRVSPEEDEETGTDIEDEIMTMVDEAQSDGDMDASESKLIRSALEFRDADALDIMTPRTDVEALESTATMEEAEQMFLRTGYSRLPIYREDMDHVIGILHEKDFYRAKHAGVKSLTGLSMPTVYVSASQKVSNLLTIFQQTRTHMVIVLDEFGGTEGIVTLEDVLEELVGEIFDEHDDISQDITEAGDGSLLVNGGVPLEDLYDRYHLDNPYESDTVGGWAAEVMGCIPKIGSVFRAEGFEGAVTGMDRLRVTQVRVKRIQDTDEENGEHSPGKE
ncbi:MAG: HlyC/CorC family transporter [Clostridia bacterium]|nr:HlyC/CorC family transporter [Clostridia bacterium]